MFQDLFDPHFWARIVFSLACGFVIGLERQIRGKPMGIRTCILICMGTTLFIYVGLQIDGGRDLARIMGQIVTGIGFLGAGVIITRDDVVTGVTSAAVVWLLAGIGAANGLQLYGVSVAVTIVALIVLLGMEWLERVYTGLRKGAYGKKKED